MLPPALARVALGTAAAMVAVSCAGVSPETAPPSAIGAPQNAGRAQQIESRSAAAPDSQPKPPATSSQPKLAELGDVSQMSAAAILEHAFAALRAERMRLAGMLFRNAIRSGGLNDAGRAWAYWHIYVTERDRGAMDASADALSSFVVVGQNLLERRQRIAAERAAGAAGFAKRFDLPKRLSLARAMLSVIWSPRIQLYGRSKSRPMVVKNAREIDYFIQLAAPCGNSDVREITADALKMRRAGPTQQVTVDCQARRSLEYYFAPSAGSYAAN